MFFANNFLACKTVKFLEGRVASFHFQFCVENENTIRGRIKKRVKALQHVAGPVAVDTAKPEGRPVHPTVYVTPDDVQRARRNAAQTAWGKAEKAAILENAKFWLAHDEVYWLKFLPAPGACYAYGFTGCPICYSSCGTWPEGQTVVNTLRPYLERVATQPRTSPSPIH